MSTRFMATLAGVAVVVLIVVYSSFFVVMQTEQALVLQFGKPVRAVSQAGLDVKLPYQDVVKYDHRVLDLEPPAEEVIASDQKRLVVDTYARYRIADPLQFYQSVESEIVARTRLSSIISAALRRVIGNVELQAVISERRAGIMRQIRDEVNAQAKGFGIDVIDVRIKRADLPEENSQAIYDRMKSEPRRGGAPGAGNPRRRRPSAHRNPGRCPEAIADIARPGRCRQHPHLRRRLWPGQGFLHLLPLAAGLQ